MRVNLTIFIRQIARWFTDIAVFFAGEPTLSALEHDFA